MILCIIIYFTGLIITRSFLHFFSEEIGINYNLPKTYATQDDWDSNDQAFNSWSIGWFVFIPITFTTLIMVGLVKLGLIIINRTDISVLKIFGYKTKKNHNRTYTDTISGNIDGINGENTTYTDYIANQFENERTI